MDIALLSRMLKEQILVNDEVSLPGLGVFVAELVPASFSDRGLTVNPPYRRLSFVQKNSEDRLLAQMYAAGNGISPDMAQLIIGKTVQELKATLSDRKAVVFPGLGRLRSTREDNIFFVPEEDLDIYPDGSGLEPVSLRTHTVTEQDIADAVKLLPKQDELSSEAGLASAGSSVPPGQALPLRGPLPLEPRAASLTEQYTPSPAIPVGTVSEALRTAPDFSTPGRTRFFWWVTALVVLAGLALGAFLLLCHLAPDFIDSILYTPEELRIINY